MTYSNPDAYELFMGRWNSQLSQSVLGFVASTGCAPRA